MPLPLRGARTCQHCQPHGPWAPLQRPLRGHARGRWASGGAGSTQTTRNGHTPHLTRRPLVQIPRAADRRPPDVRARAWAGPCATQRGAASWPQLGTAGSTPLTRFPPSPLAQIQARTLPVPPHLAPLPIPAERRPAGPLREFAQRRCGQHARQHARGAPRYCGPANEPPPPQVARALMLPIAQAASLTARQARWRATRGSCAGAPKSSVSRPRRQASSHTARACWAAPAARARRPNVSTAPSIFSSVLLPATAVEASLLSHPCRTLRFLGSGV